MDALSNLVARFFNEKTNQIIYNASNGTFSVGPGPDDNKDQHWKLEPVNGKSSTYKLRNILTNNVIYNASNGTFGVGPDSTDNEDQHWILEPVSGKLSTYKLRNSLTKKVIYNASNGTFGAGPDSTDNEDQWWKIVLLADITTALDEINFPDNPFDPSQEKLDSVWKDYIDNDAGVVLTKAVSKKIQKDSTFGVTLQQTLAYGASASFEIGIPYLGSTEVTVSTELSLSAGQTWETTKSEQYEFTQTIEVPAKTKVKVVGQLKWIEDAKIPYSIRLWITGKTKTTNVKLTNSQIKIFLLQNGFTGTIVDDTLDRGLLVELKAILSGSWGTETIIKTTNAA